MTDSPLKYPARVNVLMLATCSGAKAGANSMTTRPPGNSTYRVFSGSSGRQSAGLEAANTSGILWCLAAAAGCDKKTCAPRIKILKLRLMSEVLHKSVTGQGACMSRGEMRRILFCCLALAIADLKVAPAGAQGYPNTGPGSVPSITGSGGRTSQHEEIPSAPAEVKPDKAAAKAYAAGTKSMAKARELEDAIAKATDPDKKAKAFSKLEDTYGKALDQFT